MVKLLVRACSILDAAGLGDGPIASSCRTGGDNLVRIRRHRERIYIFFALAILLRVLSHGDSRIAIRVADSRFLKNSMLIHARFL